MKKLVFGFLATVMIANVSFGQNNNNLSEDNDFIELVAEMNSFKNFIDETITKQNLSLNNVVNQLSEINNQKLDYETQLLEINKIFNKSVSDRYIDHMKIFNTNWMSINKKFKSITPKYLEEEYLAVMNKTDASFSGGTGCGWRYNLCIVAAGAGAVLCHAGCDTTALAVSAGLGIPACIWLCGTLQVAASVQCYDTYCN